MKHTRTVWVYALALTVAVICGSIKCFAADWPQFGRDGTRNAVSPERRPPMFWELGKRSETNSRQRILGSSRNVKWSAQLGSFTYGDPVVADGLIWVGTNNHWTAQDKVDASLLSCFRESDGALLYQYVSPRLPQGRTLDWERRSLSCSPLIDRDRLWFVTNRAEVVCLDIGPIHRGKGEPTVVWKVDLIEKFGVFPRGASMGYTHSCSVAGHKDLLYVITGNGVGEKFKQVEKPEAPSLICFQRDTGDAVWQDRSPGENILDGQWSSPTIVELDGVVQCVAAQGDGWVRSFDALSGKPIWQFDMNYKEGRWAFERTTRYNVLGSPVLADKRIYIATGVQPEQGERPGRLVCLDPSRCGDISSELAIDRDGNVLPQRRIQAVEKERGEKSIQNPNTGLVWEFTGAGQKFEEVMHTTMCNVVVHQGLVIAPDEVGVVHCLDAKTGRHYWAYDLLASVWGSPLIVGDKVYVADIDGVVSIFGLSADPDVAQRRLNGASRPLRQITHDSTINCSPLFANGVLYLATLNELIAIAADKDEPDLKLDAGYWPQWRGPNRDNASSEKGLLKDWPEGGPPRLWTAIGLGDGIASVSVAEGDIFTLGYQDEREFAIALDEMTGELRWAAYIGPSVAEHTSMRWVTQRTPTVDGARLYTTSAAGDLACLTTAGGRELWRKSYTVDFEAKRPTWGFCDSPLVDGEKVICTPGGPRAKIVALDKLTGNVLWKSAIPGAEDERAAYAALVVVEVEGLRQYVTFLAKGLVSVAADDGRFLWRYDTVANTVANTQTPLVRGDRIFCSSGWGQGYALLKLVRNGRSVAVEEVYNKRMWLDGYQDASAIIGDHVYLLRAGIAAVPLDLKTGEISGEALRIPGGGRMAVVSTADSLYYRSSSGMMTLVQNTPERIVPRGVFHIPGHVEASGVTSPVIAGHRLYLRDNDRLHCYDIRARCAAAPVDSNPQDFHGRPGDSRPHGGSASHCSGRTSPPERRIRSHTARRCQKDVGPRRSEKGQRRF